MRRKTASGNAWRIPACQTLDNETISKAFSKSERVAAEECPSAVAASSNKLWCQTAPSAERPWVAQSYDRACCRSQFWTVFLRTLSHTRTMVGRTPMGRRPPSALGIRCIKAVAIASGQYPVRST